jgi:two-component system OmpR family sensor kinase/two-component system sensor histidine kinase BaeS
MNRLWAQLSLAFAAVSLLAAGLLTTGALLLIRGDGPSYAEELAIRAAEPGGLAEILARDFAETGTWNGAPRILHTATHLMPEASPDSVVLELVDGRGQHLAATPPKATLAPDEAALVPVLLDGHDEPVATLRISLSYRLAAIQLVVRLLLRFALLSAVLGIIFGLWMSRSISRPLDALASAARALGTGERRRRVEVKGTIEIQEVARAFNEMAEDLERQEHLRRDMVADIAHELRTPLSVLQANLEALLDGILPFEPAEAARLADQVRHLSRRVTDLRELAMAEAGQLEMNPRPLDVATLLGDTADAFAALAEMAGVSIEVEADADLPSALADPERLAQVLQNLVTNAVCYSPADGIVTLRAGIEAGDRPSPSMGGIGDRSGAGWRSEVASDDVRQLRISVVDQGPGLSADDSEKVFERFYRADPARTRQSGGAGLGLAIARSIVEAHGGTIDVQSEPGKGCEFVILLPVASER